MTHLHVNLTVTLSLIPITSSFYTYAYCTYLHAGGGSHFFVGCSSLDTRYARARGGVQEGLELPVLELGILLAGYSVVPVRAWER